MNKNKRTILISSIILGSILLILTIVSIILNNYNKQYKNQEQVYICIYQYEVEDYNINYNSEKKLYKKILFNNDTKYDEVVTSLDTTGNNHIIINDGVVYISDSTCLNQICMKSVIRYNDSLINNLVITCMPNGLVITVERS